MIRPNPTPPSQADDLNRQFLFQMHCLQKAISSGDENQSMEFWNETRNFVDALPIPTDQYDLAVSRLHNCKRYLVSEEFGAAAYELKLLAGTIEFEEPVRKPRYVSAKRQAPVVFEPVETEEQAVHS